MRIGIFNEPKGLAFGGTEFCVATLAEALCDRHEVVILHRKERMSLESLERFYGSPLSSVKVLRAPKCPRNDSLKPTDWRHSQSERRHDRKWTADYDIFVAFTHNPPPYCFARTGILIALFPVGQQPALSTAAKFSFRQKAREALAQWFWRNRMDGYGFPLAISEYTRKWTRSYWGVECGILHPPCRILTSSPSKEHIILSAGRFTPFKRQTALMKAYRLLEPHIPEGWKYRSVGPLSADEESTAYYREVAVLAEGARAELCTNLSREALDEEYRGAMIFWHGAGENESGDCTPLLAEHFGITTVEAMSAGCVPIVHNKGGQREIVEHGISGFLWDTIDELHAYTKKLIGDCALRNRMADAACRRAQSFSQEAFVTRFKEILAPRVRL